MSCTCDLCQQLNFQVDDRQNVTINQNYNYQNLILYPQYYQHYQDARSSAAQYFSVPPPPPPSVFPSLFATANISYDTARNTYTQIINETCQAELNRLRMDFRICREILTIQMKVNAILFDRYYR